MSVAFLSAVSRVYELSLVGANQAFLLKSASTACEIMPGTELPGVGVPRNIRTYQLTLVLSTYMCLAGFGSFWKTSRNLVG